MVISLRKKEVFSLVTNPSRNTIIKRLHDAEKAAYSDLLDSAGLVSTLDSTGNFNYHLNFLADNEIIVKTGSVYRLTDKGKEIARFIKDIDQKWLKLEKTINGDLMSLLSLAEQFEENTGLKMLKEISDFKGIEMVMDETRNIGLIITDQKPTIFKKHSEIDIEKFQLIKKKKGTKNYTVLGHTEFEHYLSQKYFSLIQDFIVENYEEIYVYADNSGTAPFLISSVNLENGETGLLFLVAPIEIQ